MLGQFRINSLCISIYNIDLYKNVIFGENGIIYCILVFWFLYVIVFFVKMK